MGHLRLPMSSHPRTCRWVPGLTLAWSCKPPLLTQAVTAARPNLSPASPPDAFASSTTEEAKRRSCRVTLCAVGCSPGQALPKPSSNTHGGGQGSTNRTQATAPRSVRWRIAGLNPCPPLFDTARSGQKNPFSFTGLWESAPGKEGWSHKSLFWPQIKASLGGTPRIPQF